MPLTGIGGSARRSRRQRSTFPAAALDVPGGSDLAHEPDHRPEAKAEELPGLEP